MRCCVGCLALVATVGVSHDAGAQSSQLPIPAFSQTYSYPTHTRGFFFQAPSAGAPFLITGLRVPDDTGFGVQHVEVIDLGGDPTGVSLTGTQLFFAGTQPSNAVIPTSILVQPGQWIGILGGCGDPTILHSSYGVGPFLSDLFGTPVPLDRLACQSNISVTGGNQPVRGGTPFLPIPSPLGRVEVTVAPAPGHASVALFGTGCGTPPVGLDSARPVQGASIPVTVSAIPANTIIGAIVLSGVRAPSGSQPLPGLAACVQLVGLDDLYYFTPSGPQETLQLNVPGAGLTGMLVFAQAILFAPAGSPAGIVSSNGLEWRINAL